MRAVLAAACGTLLLMGAMTEVVAAGATGKVPPGCVRFEGLDIGVTNITKVTVVAGQQVAVRLTNWVPKVGGGFGGFDTTATGGIFTSVLVKAGRVVVSVPINANTTAFTYFGLPFVNKAISNVTACVGLPPA